MKAIRIQWDPAAAGNGNLWDEFVRLAQEYFDTGQLDSEENDYKVDIGRKVAAAREAALSSADDWADLLKSALNPNDANFISWRLISNLNQWCAGHPDEALRALQAIWAQDASSVSERVGAFGSLLPYSEIRGTGSRVNVASGLLMGLDVHNYPPFRIRVFNRAYERTGYEQPERDADEAALYEHALGFLDRFIEEASERGLTLRHRLDAQSLVWAILQGRDQPTEPEDTPPLPTDPWTPANIEALARELLWETGELQKIVDGLKDKRQVIFQGPPGTGKTYVAKRIAEWCREHGGDFQIVQFHPSYSYEDFVEGLTTGQDAGESSFELRHTDQDLSVGKPINRQNGIRELTPQCDLELLSCFSFQNVITKFPRSQPSHDGFPFSQISLAKPTLAGVIVDVVDVAIDDLHPDSANPRRITPAQLNALPSQSHVHVSLFGVVSFIRGGLGRASRSPSTRRPFLWPTQRCGSTETCRTRTGMTASDPSTSSPLPNTDSGPAGPAGS